MNLFNWDFFLKLVDKKKIVPVIGSELFLVVKDGKTLPFYGYFTKKLGEALNIDPGDLNFREFALENKNIDYFKEVRETVFEEIISEKILITDHLEKLSRITGFSFYISTTSDDIFESILVKERCAPGQMINSICYSFPALASGEKIDKNENTKVPTVFKILGSFRNKTCAVTDGEILEYIFSLNRDNPIRNLLYDEITDKKLLFLGFDYPDWLLRFFIRILTNESFEASQTEKIIADNYVHKDTKLSLFLKHFKTQIISLTQDDFKNPVTFIGELYDRWIDFKSKDFDRKFEGTVFLSYSHHDKDPVLRIQNEMLARGINVWIDDNKLKSGDNYRQIINDTIRECAVLVAFISESSISKKESYVYDVEWDLAIARRKIRENVSDISSFIHPVILDNTEVTDNRIPAEFRQMTIQKLNTNQLIELVKQKLIPVSHD